MGPSNKFSCRCSSSSLTHCDRSGMGPAEGKGRRGREGGVRSGARRSNVTEASWIRWTYRRQRLPVLDGHGIEQGSMNFRDRPYLRGGCCWP
jgi:hypothetical protein